MADSAPRAGGWLSWGGLSLASGLLCVGVVAGVGAVALGAELVATWRSYFVMETAMALGAPAATGLLGLGLCSALVAIATS